MADNLPPSSADVTESGSLNLPEPSRPHRPVMGLLYLYFTVILLLLLLAIKSKHLDQEYPPTDNSTNCVDKCLATLIERYC
jgi:hypothetical protein